MNKAFQRTEGTDHPPLLPRQPFLSREKNIRMTETREEKLMGVSKHVCNYQYTTCLHKICHGFYFFKTKFLILLIPILFYTKLLPVLEASFRYTEAVRLLKWRTWTQKRS